MNQNALLMLLQNQMANTPDNRSASDLLTQYGPEMTQQILRNPELAALVSRPTYEALQGVEDRRNAGAMNQFDSASPASPEAVKMNDTEIAKARALRNVDSAVWGPGGRQYGGVGRMEPLPDPNGPSVAPNFGQTAAEAQGAFLDSRRKSAEDTAARIAGMGEQGLIKDGVYTTRAGNPLAVSQVPTRDGQTGYKVQGTKSRSQWDGEVSTLPGANGRTNAEMVAERRGKAKAAEPTREQQVAKGLDRQQKMRELRDPEAARRIMAMRAVEQALGGGGSLQSSMLANQALGMSPDQAMRAAALAQEETTRNRSLDMQGQQANEEMKLRREEMQMRERLQGSEQSAMVNAMRMKAMGEVVATLPPGPQRDAVMAEYRTMLGLTGAAAEPTPVGLEPTLPDGTPKNATTMANDLSAAVSAGNISPEKALAQAEVMDQTTPFDARKNRESVAAKLRARLKQIDSYREQQREGARMGSGVELMY